MTEKRIYFFGGSHIQRLLPLMQENCAGSLLGVSPLSSVEAGRFWLEELDAALEQAQAEYLVLDLQTAMQNLLYAGGEYLTATKENEARLQTAALAVVEPMGLPEQQLHETVDRLIYVLRTHFSHRNIILLHTYIPEFYWIGNAPRMRDGFASYAPRQKWMDALEAYFAQNTRCHVVDTEKYYFHKKEVGRPLTELIFEDLCYEDLARCVKAVLQGKPVPGRPDFRSSLRRFVKGKFTLYQRAFTVFLNREYLLDSFVFSATKQFVEENLEDIALLDALDWSQPEKALPELPSTGASERMQKLFYTFAQLTAGVYTDPNADYPGLFREAVVPEKLLGVLRENLCQKEKLLTGQINPGNAGFWFAKMQGLPTEPFVSEHTVERPTLVDIYGSCISRTTFNIYEFDCAVNRYWFQIPPFQSLNKRVTYPAAMFPERPHWADRLVKDQFDGVIYDQVAASKAEWLVIDLFSFITNVQYQYEGCYYTDFNARISKQLGAKNVMVCTDSSVIGTWEQMLEKMEPWFALVRKKYGDSIILINGQRNDYWIGDDGQIYKKPVSDGKMAFMDRAFRDVGEKLDCYCIDTYKPFLPDDSGYISNTPSHKEDDCYLYAHKLIRRIMKEKPEQKLYTAYPGSIQVKRLLRLTEHNSPAKLEQALMLTELDRCVIRMEREDILRYKKELEELYDSGATTVPRAGLFSRKRTLAELLNRAKKLPGGEAEFAGGYAPYGEDSGTVGMNGFTSPVQRKLELRQITLEQGKPKLYCVSAADATVLVLRRTAATQWQLVKRAPVGWIVDTTAQPMTEYVYMACVETEHNGKRYMGNFTPEKTCVTGPANPTLSHAVTVGGRNCLRWQKVEGADGYYIYHKQEPTDGWVRCASVDGNTTLWTEPAENGKLYTLRAYSNRGGQLLASGHEPATAVEPL